MANITNARGKIIFKADNNETVESLLKLFNDYAGEGVYNTTANFIGKVENNCYETSFKGKGRYNYLNNIKGIFKCFKFEIDSSDNKENLKLYNELKELNFEIEFNYIDWEVGESFLLENISLIHQSGIELTECEIKNLSEVEGDNVSRISPKEVENLIKDMIKDVKEEYENLLIEGGLK